MEALRRRFAGDGFEITLKGKENAAGTGPAYSRERTGRGLSPWSAGPRRKGAPSGRCGYRITGIHLGDAGIYRHENGITGNYPAGIKKTRLKTWLNREWRIPPKAGERLNMAETELIVQNNHGLPQRIPAIERMREAEAWNGRRNKEAIKPTGVLPPLTSVLNANGIIRSLNDVGTLA